jgi:integrase
MSKTKVSKVKAKEPIKLRFNELKNGNKSAYLARWNNDNDRWEYEFLRDLYIVPDKGDQTLKAQNEHTLKLANAIKAKRTVELQNNTHGFTNTDTRSKVNFIEYIKLIADKKRVNAGGGKRTTEMIYLALARQIEDYSGIKTTFKQINKEYCNGYIEHLKTAKNRNNGQLLNGNTIASYVRLFSTVLNNAINDELIAANYMKQIRPEDKPQKHKIEISYLTIEELKTLENTPFYNEAIKQSFLFSCYTGLRYSDVRDLTWGKLQKDNQGETYIKYVQKKTQKPEYLPIPQKAKEFIPVRTNENDTDKVFKLPTSGYTNFFLKTWSALAKLNKHLTFHVARHTYATVLLSLGAPIEVISKTLGHSDIKTTQDHYAAIVNESKRQAVSLFDKIR